jgi:hypothetical protein
VDIILSPFGFLSFKDYLALSVPDEGYSRNPYKETRKIITKFRPSTVNRN